MAKASGVHDISNKTIAKNKKELDNSEVLEMNKERQP